MGVVVDARETITTGLGSIRRGLGWGSDMFVLSMFGSSGVESDGPSFFIFCFSRALLRRAVGSVNAARIQKPTMKMRASAPNTMDKINFSRRLSPAG